jgi:hypothetical protein
MVKLLGAVIGVAVAYGAIYGLELVNRNIFGWPVTGTATPASIEAAQITAQAMAVGGWFLGALAGGLIAVRIAGGARAGWIVALLVGAGTLLLSTTLVPHPLWMQIAAGVAPLFAGLVVQGASGAA